MTLYENQTKEIGQETDSAKFILRAPGGAAGGMALFTPLEAFTDLSEAERSVRSRPGHVVGGAIPFDPAFSRNSCSLYLGRPRQNIPDQPESRYETEPKTVLVPDRAFNEEDERKYLRNASLAIEMANSPEEELEKVVLSRQEQYSALGAIDPPALFSRICNAYPATANYFVEHLNYDDSVSYSLGASPELFLRKEGRVITMTPMAGTLPSNPAIPVEEDRKHAADTLYTEKYLSEHRYLVDFMVERLREFCVRIDHSETPQLFHPPKVWHLGTRLRGELRSSRIPISELVEALHPSPAVCGIPQTAALDLIDTLDSPRRYYGGLVGWMDSSDNCVLYMALRGVDLDLTEQKVSMRAGGGIVAGSDPLVELTETVAKMSTMGALL